MRLLRNKTRWQFLVSPTQCFWLHVCSEKCWFWMQVQWGVHNLTVLKWLTKAGKHHYLSTKNPKSCAGGVRNTSLFCILPDICFWTRSEEIVIPIRAVLCWNVEFFRNFSLTLALADKILAMPKTTCLGICCSWAQRYHTLSTAVHTANGLPQLTNGIIAMKTDNAQIFFLPIYFHLN